MNVMDWLAKMLGLPEKFLHHHPDSVGGGVLQVAVSEVASSAYCFHSSDFPSGWEFSWRQNQQELLCGSE